MGYIDNNLVADEQIGFKTGKSLIIFFFPVVVAVLAAYTSHYMQANQILKPVAWVPFVIVLIYWCYALLEYGFSEFAVTNKRVMMREGFFVRRANEMRLSAISQVNIDQSILGQMFNYGVVTINAFGATDSYPVISGAVAFQRAVNEQTLGQQK
jgi:uncharacterized membrane protein YdbT with pleckstrin-like domain